MDKTEFLVLFLIAIVSIAVVFQIFDILLKEKGKDNNKMMKNQDLIKLPEPRYESDTCVEEAILRRRSVRSYRDEALSLKEISQILWAAQGITEKRGYKRAAPSAGATYPLEIYVVVGKLEGIAPGIYHYIPKEHSLKRTISGDYRKRLADAALGQSFVEDAPIDLVFCAVYERTTSRYGERGIKYVHMEVGHAAQNVYLQCQSLDLGTVVVGAFDDNKIKKILNLEKEEPLYVMPVGRI